MESAFHAWLQQVLPSHPRWINDLWDDAALLDWSAARECVVSTDLLADGVHFRSDQVPLERVGRKCLAVSLSDMAAMAARPVAAFVSLLLPRRNATEAAQRLLQGMLPLCRQFQLALAGGDTNTWNGALVVDVMVLGEPSPKGVWSRRSARPDDAVMVTGALGGSILGHHLDFIPRLHEAWALQDAFEIHAALDVSDGLALDASRICRASRCGMVLDRDAIPIRPDAFVLSEQDPSITPLEHALHDGEDFELLFTCAPQEADRMLADRQLQIPVTRIGLCTAELGLWSSQADGALNVLPETGYEHGEEFGEGGSDRPAGTVKQ